MEIREAYELSFKLWIWLFKHPGKEKKDSPDWNQVHAYKDNCPLCEYYSDNDGCIGCAGDINNIDIDFCFSGAFYDWAMSDYQRKSAAAYIASKIRRYMIKQGWYTKECKK